MKYKFKNMNISFKNLIRITFERNKYIGYFRSSNGTRYERILTKENVKKQIQYRIEKEHYDHLSEILTNTSNEAKLFINQFFTKDILEKIDNYNKLQQL